MRLSCQVTSTAYLTLPSLSKAIVGRPAVTAAATPRACTGRYYGFAHTRAWTSAHKLLSKSLRIDIRMAATSTATPLPKRPVTVPFYGERPYPQVLVEVFLDYNCPYSKKAFLTLWQEVLPHYRADLRVQFAFGLVPQPWHAQTCYMHEAALAARQVSGDAGFWKASAALFAQQEDWVDEKVLDKTRRQVYEELAQCLAKAGVVSSASLITERLLTASGNSGNAVGADVKFACRYHRVRGVHMTPTVHINGIPELNASSSWTVQEWKERIDSLLSSELSQ
jgi:hypothetical protein